MLKREITYEDFDGDEVTEVFYFNISKPELVELEVEYKEGFEEMLKRIVKSEDNKTILELFKRIILLAYGEKSDDGKRFVKSDEIRENFKHTAAYQVLFMELLEDEKAAATFVTAVLPKDIQERAKQTVDDANVPAEKVAPVPPPIPSTKQ